MANEPWYERGLGFRCTGFGHCCRGAPGYVWVDEGEIRALAASRGLSLDEFGRRYLRRVGRRYSLLERGNGDCVFFQHGPTCGGGCAVYDARPRQCRTYPFWPENLESPAAWDEVCRECPGSAPYGESAGRLYRVEEIRAILEEDRDASA